MGRKLIVAFAAIAQSALEDALSETMASLCRRDKSRTREHPREHRTPERIDENREREGGQGREEKIEYRRDSERRAAGTRP